MKNKIITIMLALVIFFSSLTSVSAKTLTIEEIDVQVKKIFKEYFKADMATQIDKENNKYMILGADEIEDKTVKFDPLTFTIEDGYLQYSDSRDINGIEKDPQKMLDALGTQMTAYLVIQSAIEASGYTDKTISADEELLEKFGSEDSFFNYGLFISTQHYEKHLEESGVTTNITLDYLRALKLSLDTAKIDALVAKYGVDKPIEEEKTNENKSTDNKSAEDSKGEVKEEIKEEPKEEKHYENPETGAFLPTSVIIGSSVVAAVLIILARRYTSFRRI